jgi:hypothetical protein
MEGACVKSTFWIIAIVLCFTVSESFVNWMLAVFVGNHEIADGFNRAFQYFSFKGYLFSLAFRAIPFIALFVVVGILKSKLIKYINAISWCWLIGIVFFIGFGYWDVQHSLYTNAHTSSTSAIAFIFIPIYAVAVGLVSGVFGLLCAVIYSQIRTRRY